MIWRYLIKRFSFIVTFFLLIFGSLQLSLVQNKILKLCVGKEINVDFFESSGVFPFNFSIKNLKISSKDFLLETDNLHIKLSGKLTHIKKVSIEKINLKSFQNTKLSFSDVRYLLPIFVQKIVKEINIKELNINDKILKKLSFSYDKDIGIRYLEIMSEYGIISSSWKFDKKNIFANAKFNDFSFQAIYGVDNRHMNLSLNYKAKEIKFDGILDEKSLNGVLSLPFYELKPSVVISLENEILNVIFREEKLAVSGKAQYDFSKFMVFINNVIFDNGTIIKPFSIVDFSKIP